MVRNTSSENIDGICEIDMSWLVDEPVSYKFGLARCNCSYWRGGEFFVTLFRSISHRRDPCSFQTDSLEAYIWIPIIRARCLRDRDIFAIGISVLLRKCHDILTLWWRHQMETFSALLAICAGNSPVTGEFHAQRPVTRSFDVFFDLRLHKRLSKQS